MIQKLRGTLAIAAVILIATGPEVATHQAQAQVLARSRSSNSSSTSTGASHPLGFFRGPGTRDPAKGGNSK